MGKLVDSGLAASTPMDINGGRYLNPMPVAASTWHRMLLKAFPASVNAEAAGCPGRFLTNSTSNNGCPRCRAFAARTFLEGESPTLRAPRRRLWRSGRAMAARTVRRGPAVASRCHDGIGRF